MQGVGRFGRLVASGTVDVVKRYALVLKQNTVILNVLFHQQIIKSEPDGDESTGTGREIEGTQNPSQARFGSRTLEV